MSNSKIVVFYSKEIRRTLHNDEWWFVVNDIVSAFTDSINVQDYVKKMRKRDEELNKGWGQIVTPLPLPVDTACGKQKLNRANTKGIC
jgi:prophage antirepressor-like protein